MKTAAEFWLDNYFSDSISHEDKKLWLECNNQAQITVSIMIEFAKMHVKAALEAAEVQAENLLPEGCWDYLEDVNFIKNSYPESNIK